MFKTVLAVVSGYLVMVALVTPIFSLVYLAPELVFEEGQAKATIVFSVSTLVLGFAGALVGGLVAAKLGGGRSAPVTALALVVLGLGLATGLQNALAEPPPETTPEQVAEMSIEERVAHAREPVWYGFTTPVIGALAIGLGGRLYRRRPKPE